MSKAHYINIDYIKTISIIMIIIYHCDLRNYLGFSSAFMLMGVCFFFSVNGFLVLSKERANRYYIKKILNILILIIYWSVISISTCMYYKNETINIKAIILHLYNLDNYYCNYLWFMVAMVSLYAIAPIIKVCIKYGYGKYLLLLVAVSVLLRPILWKFNFLNGEFCHSILWYILGFYIFEGALKNKSTIKILYLFLLSCVIYYIYDSYIDIKIIKHVFGSIYTNIMFVLMVIFSLELLRRLYYKDNKFIRVVSNNTLGIYLIQGPVYKGLLAYYPLIEQYYIIFPIAVFVISLCVVFIMKRCYLNFLIRI